MQLLGCLQTGLQVPGQSTGIAVGAQPIVRHPLGTPVHGRQWNSLDPNRQPPGVSSKGTPRGVQDVPLGSPLADNSYKCLPQ
ncbi:UNVERIFIED_CONTAM: hypothetical protein FKN15_024253 [Acipenser sinensis]